MKTAKTAAQIRAAAVGALAPAIAPLFVVTVAVAEPLEFVRVDVTLGVGVMVPVETTVLVTDPLVTTLEVVKREPEDVTVVVVTVLVVKTMGMVETASVDRLPLDSVTVVYKVVDATTDADPVDEADADEEKSVAATVNGLVVVYTVDGSEELTSATVYEPGF